MLFSRKKEFGGTYSYLIVGLGNPGPKYEMTRHNAGFLAVDLLALQEHVAEAANFYKIPPERVLVLFDDISLDVGRTRVRRKGSAGGHNGIKSIIARLGSQDFPRVKIGVGQKPTPAYDLADWVLGRFPKEQEPALKTALEHATAAVRLLVEGKTDEAMNLYNR